MKHIWVNCSYQILSCSAHLLHYHCSPLLRLLFAETLGLVTKQSMDFLDLDIEKIFSESLDNIETTVDEWIETMKDKVLSKETLEVLDHCKVLLGKKIFVL